VAQHNSSFSPAMPRLQIYVDASSLTEFKICPKRYFYSIVMGRQPSAESIHLTFGILLHKGAEMYHKLVFGESFSHNEAVHAVVNWVMEATWDRTHNRPWTSGDKHKNRFTLVRTLVWYLDQYEHDELETVILKDGRPAVELPFAIKSGYLGPTGEDIVICGTLDRVTRWKRNNKYYVCDIKTTKNTVGSYYFDRYTPDNQVTVYRRAGQSLLEEPVDGLIIDACQIAVEFSRFERGFIERSDDMLTSWHKDLGYWLLQMGTCAEANDWPRNDTACNHYGGCPFRAVCSQKTEEHSARVLESAYAERTWDPLRNRMAF
jgi:hypothetical protein